MNEYIEYLERGFGRITAVPTFQIILVHLACDPFFDFIIKLDSNSARLKDFQEFFKASHANPSFRWRLTDTLNNIQPPYASVPKFLASVKEIGNSSVKTTKELLEFVDDTTVIGFYACLILAHCHEIGLGVTKSEENVFKYLEKAIVISNQYKSDNTAIFLTEEFLEDFTLKNNSKKILCYRIRLLELERKGITIPKSTREHAKNMTYLNEFFSPTLTALDQGDPNYENQRSKILEFLEIIKKKRIDYKIAYYIKRTEELTKYSLSQQEYLSFYNALNEDKDLKDFTGGIQKLFDALDKLSDFKYQLRDYENATRFAISLFNLSKSPKVAIKLGEMAANGHLVFADMPEQPEGQQKLCSNFYKASEYYEVAIDQALQIFDIETATLAIQEYLRIEENVSLDKRIDLQSKIKSIMDRLLSLDTEEQIKDFLSSPSSNFLKITLGEKTELKFIEFIATNLIVLLLQLPRTSENLSYLQKVYLKIENPTGDGWVKILANSVKYDPDKINDPTYKAIITLIQERLPTITDLILANVNKVLLIPVKGLIRAIINHNLDINPSSQINHLANACNQVLAARLRQAVLENNIESLTILKEIYELLKDRGSRSPFFDRTDELTYWIVRNSFESTFKEGKKTTVGQGTIFNIYAFSASKKANESPGLLRTPFLVRLKNLGHREAFLKMAELLLLEFDTNPDPFLPRDTAVNIVKTMSCQQPADNSGIYSQLALERMKTLQDKVADEKKYNDLHRTTVKFFYGLSLLITNPNKYKDDHVSLFEGKKFNDLIPIIFALFSDPVLSFSNEVKREVLTKMEEFGAQNLIDKKLRLDISALLAKLPPAVMQVETVGTLAPAAAEESALQRSVPPTVSPSFSNNDCLKFVDLYSAMSPIPVPRVDEVPPPVFSSPPEDIESVARLKSELDSMRLLYQQSLIAAAQKDAQLQQKEVALEAVKTDITKAQKEIDCLNRRATKFLDFRSEFVAKQKALAAELEAPIDSDEEGSGLVKKF